MSERIYCKDCRFYEDGWCQRMPPTLVSWHKDALFPKVDKFDWCGMAERREDVKPGGFDIDKIEAGDVVYFTSNNEIGKMKAENNRLRGLITEIRDFLIGGAIPGFVHLKHECIQSIYRIANEEDKNRRKEKTKEQNGKKQERNLEEEAHQLGLSSWDRVDKWLKELESQNQNQKKDSK